MFRNLTDFKFKRTGLQAFGFYLAYLFLFLLLGFLSGFIMALIGARDNAFSIGVLVAMITSPTLTFLVLYQKGLVNKLGYILLLVLTPILAFLAGALVGLIPVAILTTIKPANEIQQEENPSNNDWENLGL